MTNDTLKSLIIKIKVEKKNVSKIKIWPTSLGIYLPSELIAVQEHACKSSDLHP